MPLPPDASVSGAHPASNPAAAPLPHGEAALAAMQGAMSPTADAAATLASLRAAVAPQKKRAKTTTLVVGPAAKRGAAGKAAPLPAPLPACVRLVMTSITCLRRMHVAAELATLLPDMSAHVPKERHRFDTNGHFFKTSVTMIDDRGTRHTVVYESFRTPSGRHTRLSNGWSTMRRQLGVEVGDAVLIELRGRRSKGVLHVRKEVAGA